VDVQPIGRRQALVTREHLVQDRGGRLAAAHQPFEARAHPFRGRDQAPEEILGFAQVGTGGHQTASADGPENDAPPGSGSWPESGSWPGSDVRPERSAWWSERAFSDPASSRSKLGILSSHSIRLLTAPKRRTASA